MFFSVKKPGNLIKRGLQLFLLLGMVSLLPALTVSAAKPAATIGSKKYKTLEAAIDAVKKGQTIVVQKNLTNQLPISLDRKTAFVLDMNHHKYSTYSGVTAFVLNAGKMTVKNAKKMTSSTLFHVNEGAALAVKNGSYVGGIINYGTASIQGGSFSNTDGKTNVLDNRKGKMTVFGGTFTQKNTKYYLISNTGTITIKGGRFTGGLGNHTEKTAKMIISGGTFRGNDKENTIINGAGTTLRISGGTFTAVGNFYVLNNEGKSYLSGGTFLNESDALWTKNKEDLKVGRKVKYSGKIIVG